jgi:DtxR family Mn-dependent transcriptional regulator
MAGYHPAVEEYLETILELEESGIRPMRARIVERLGVSAPAVSETVRRLEREGYLTLDETRAISLTDEGRNYATAIMRRHRLAERLLVDVLHVPWSQVHEEAGRLEHAISPRLEQHLVALLGDPATCPHGNPIPGSANSVDVGPLLRLSDVSEGEHVVVRRIDEELEAQYNRMLELEDRGVMPGRLLLVKATTESAFTGEVDGVEVGLDGEVARLVYVSRE